VAETHADFRASDGERPLGKKRPEALARSRERSERRVKDVREPAGWRGHRIRRQQREQRLIELARHLQLIGARLEMSAMIGLIGEVAR
jgi:hypothetical protein